MADIRFSGKRMFYFTGYRIDLNKFNSGTQLANKNATGKEGTRTVQYNVINNRLKAIKASLVLYFQNINEGNKNEIKILLDEVCNKSKRRTTNDNSFFSMFSKYIEEEVSLSSTKNVKTVFNNWKKYEAKRKISLSFESITVETLRDFESYLKKESTPKSINTVHRFMKTSRAFWNYARKELKRSGTMIGYPFGDGYTLPGESYGKPIYITKDERNLLYNATLKNERLKRVRDIFVFQCLIGIRVGDLFKLTKANIQNNILSYIPRKTKEGKPVVVHVPLHPMAIEILSKYDIPGDALLPVMSRQRYNDYIKELFKTVGLTRIVTRLNPRTHEEEQVRICDIASSHMARRTFIGNLYGKIDNGIIISMSGHAKDSKAFSRYYDVSRDLQKNAIDNL